MIIVIYAMQHIVHSKREIEREIREKKFQIKNSKIEVELNYEH